MSHDFQNTHAMSGDEEQELCVQCMAENQPGIHFCRKCGAPLSSYAATGPFEALFAEGHLYRRAAEHPQRLIVVIGIWLIFGSVAVAGALMILFAGQTLVQLVLGSALILFSFVLIFKTTMNYRKKRVPRLEDNG